MKAKTTWVIVADDRHTKVLESLGSGRGLKPIRGAAFEAARSSGQDTYSDRPGRGFESHGIGRHAMDRPTEPETQAREAFMKRVVDWLESPKRGTNFDRLVLIAAPRTLGALRDCLSAATRKKVVFEWPKDLTKASPNDISQALSEQILI